MRDSLEARVVEKGNEAVSAREVSERADVGRSTLQATILRASPDRMSAGLIPRAEEAREEGYAKARNFGRSTCSP